MVTSAKTTAARPAKAAAKPPARRPAAAKPFLRHYHSEDLRKRTLAVLALIENAPDATAHRAELADIAVDLMKNGLDSYFMVPLKKAKAGFVTEQAANVGLMGAQQMMGTVVRNIVGRMGAPQLISVCGSIREFMK